MMRIMMILHNTGTEVSTECPQTHLAINQWVILHAQSNDIWRLPP